MSLLPIAAVVRPSSLGGATNGKLPDSILHAMGAGGPGRLERNTVRAWNALWLEMAGQGCPLTFIWGGAYRSYGDQVTVFLQRMKPVSWAQYLITSSSKRRIWVDNLGNKYWVLVTGASVASPGTSNHGWALAIDAAKGDHPSRAVYVQADAHWWSTFRALAPKYGFSWELQSEPWHIRYVAGDDLPQAVLDMEAFIAGVQVPPAPTPPPVVPPVPEPAPGPAPAPTPAQNWTEQLVNTLPDLARDTGNWPHVCKLQGLLTGNGIATGIDGIFGPATEANVVKFQKARGLTPDGRVGRQTWTALLF